MPPISCSIEESVYERQQFLALAQLGIFFAMIPYYIKIKRQWKQLEKHLLCLTTTTTTSTPSSSTCSSIQLFEKFNLYVDIVFYSLLASIIFNLFYIAFSNVSPKTKYTDFFFYVPLFVMAMMGVGYSTDAFMKIKQETSPPCKDLFRDARIFFILSLSISVCQAVVSLSINWNSYYRVESLSSLPVRRGYR
jgi:putative copper export protein